MMTERRRTRQRRMSILLIGCLLAACATTGNPLLKDDAVVEQIHIGRTTTDEVRALLGEPTMMSESEDNGVRLAVWTYTYAHAEVNGWYWVPGINLIAMLCCEFFSEEHRTLTLRFDEHGLLRGRQLSRQTISGRDIGSAIQATAADAQATRETRTPEARTAAPASSSPDP